MVLVGEHSFFGMQYKQWDPGIVFSPIDFKLFGKQAVWDMDSPFNNLMLIRVVQQQAWYFLSKIFMESQRLKVGQLSGNFKESYRKQVLQQPCPKFCIGSHWPNHIFHIHESYQIDAKGQIIAKEENHQFPRLGVEALRFGVRGTINDVLALYQHK